MSFHPLAPLCDVNERIKMNNLSYPEWLNEVYSVYWANGRFWSDLDFSNELVYLYEDDASPMEAFELTVNHTYGFNN